MATKRVSPLNLRVSKGLPPTPEHLEVLWKSWSPYPLEKEPRRMEIRMIVRGDKERRGDSAAASSWDSLLGSPGQNMINKPKRRNSKSPSCAYAY